MEERKTLAMWAMTFNVRLLDEKFYEDNELYTKEEYQEIVSRDIEVPLHNNENLPTSLDEIAKQLMPKEFAKKYKAMKQAQEELDKVEKAFKEKLKEMFESIPELETNSVTVEGIKFTYVGPSKRKTFDSKKFQEDNPKIYAKYLKESNVSSSIRTSIEW